MALKAIVTTAGAAMLTECLKLKTIYYSRAAVGSDAWTGTEAKGKTALKSEIPGVDVAISNVAYTGNAAQISVQLSTNGNQMTIREIGVYMSNVSGAAGVLALYAYYDEGESDIIAEGALFSRIYDIVMAITEGAGLTVNYAASGLQHIITANGILFGDGKGGVTAATGVIAYNADPNTYSKGNHTHNLNRTSETELLGKLPISKGGTGAATAEEARAKLGVPQIIYTAAGAVTPTVVEGAIWLQAIN